MGNFNIIQTYPRQVRYQYVCRVYMLLYVLKRSINNKIYICNVSAPCLIRLFGDWNFVLICCDSLCHYEKLSTLQWQMKRCQVFSRAKSGSFADSTRGKGRILAMLKIQPKITTKDLSYLLGIWQQSLNELLNKLKKTAMYSADIQKR